MIHKITRLMYHKAMGMLILRLATGYVFLDHGWMKLNSLDKTAGFFGSLGLPPGTATFIALVEVIGGIMLILGVAPRIAALVLGIEMLVALALVSIPHGSYQFELLLTAASFTIFMLGAGTYSLWSMERE